ncbi:MAG: hypothetical protein KC621_30835 [Myxococcales bacterium]|nr:hypothetical protein [Myxococcales bacterium]
MMLLFTTTALAEPVDVAFGARPPTLAPGNTSVEAAVDGAPGEAVGELGLAIGLPRGLQIGVTALSATLGSGLAATDPSLALGVTALSTDTTSVVVGLGSSIPLGSELAALGAELAVSVNLTDALILSATPGLSASLGARESVEASVPVQLMAQASRRLFAFAEVAAAPLAPSEGALGLGTTLGSGVLTDIVLAGHGSVAGELGAGLGVAVVVPRR